MAPNMHDVWGWKLNMIIWSSIYINKWKPDVAYNLKKSRRFKAPKMKALENASKRPKTPKSALKYFEALESTIKFSWPYLIAVASPMYVFG